MNAVAGACVCRIGWLGAVLTFVVLGTACSGDDAGESPTPAASSPTVAASTPASVSPSETAGTPAPSRTVASRTKPFGGGRARLEVYGLRRSGGLLVLDFGLRNLGDRLLPIEDAFGKGKARPDVSGVYLYDARNRVEHYPATSGGSCVCTTGLEGVAAGQVQPLSATYSPPPAGVHELDVHVPGFGDLNDVPIGT